IEAALLDYLSDKIQLPRADLSKANIKNKLQELNVGDTLTQEFLQLQQSCEMALYGGMDNTTAMDDIYERTLKLLQEMERVLNN
ncbi:MAG: protein BatD, partial [Bacteroidetes bacterium]